MKKQEAGTYTDLSTIKDGYLPGVVILGNSNYSDFNWIQSATLNGLGAVTNIPWSGIDDKLLVTLPVRYRNAFGILGKTGILGAGAASFISAYITIIEYIVGVIYAKLLHMMLVEPPPIYF